MPPIHYTKGSSHLTEPSRDRSSKILWGRLTLASLKAEGIPRYIDLIEDETIIGNETIRSLIISPVHAKIEKLAGPVYWITDCSTNGTAVNGTKIKVSRLRDGDFVMFAGSFYTELGKSMLPIDELGEPLECSKWMRTMAQKTLECHVYHFGERREREEEEGRAREWPFFDFRLDILEEPKEPKKYPDDEFITPDKPWEKRKHEEAPMFSPFQYKCIPLLECPICRLVFVDPIELECGHTFCRYCFYKKLDRNLACFSCEKKIVSAPRPSVQLAILADVHSKSDTWWTAERKDEHDRRNQRIMHIDKHYETLLTEFKSNNPDIKLDIRKKWSEQDKKLFKQTSRHCLGKCKDYYLDAIRLTTSFVVNCSDQELEIAIDNLGIGMHYTTEQQTGDKQERKIDIGLTRDRLAQFQSSFDTLFI